MDANNQRPAASGGKAAMEKGDWRAQLQPDARQRILNKIMETLKQRLPLSGKDELQKLENIAVKFEERIYSVATDQTDYLRKISFKMLTIENKSSPNILPFNAVGSTSKPRDPGASHNVQAQVNNQGQLLSVHLSVNQSQECEELPSQNMQNNIASSGVQSSAGLPSALPTVSSLNQSPISSVVVQNTNMENISGIPQNSVGNSMGQGVPTNIFAHQRQMPSMQQVSPQQQQQPSQNPQPYLDQQQIEKQLMKQKFQQGNLPHMLMQQQQKNLIESTQLQSSQQSGIQTSSVMQPSIMQSGSMSNLQKSTQANIQQNQPSSVQQSPQLMHQQNPQSVLRQLQQPQQASGLHQQQAPMMQQQLMGQQNSTSMQQNLLIGQQNSVRDMQQQQQRLLGQQNNLQNLPQWQHLQQQLMPQQNNLSNIHQEQLGPQNVPGLQQPQQQQLLGTQSGNTSMQTNQHSMNMLQQSKISLQSQTEQNSTNLLPTQEQQPQPQPPQPIMPQSQSQPAQLQQQLGLQQQSNQLQQRLQASASLDSSPQTGHTGDWQEDVYQKVKAMKETYYPELNELYQRVAAKLQQNESLPQRPNTDQIEKVKIFKTMLEQSISFLQVSKSNITPSMKDNLDSYERQIINCISTNRPRKPIPSLQQGQLPQPHMQAMQQSQSQIPQVQSHESQLSPELQTMNLQGSVPAMRQNNMSSVQHNSLSSLSGIRSSQQMRNAIQPGSNLNSGQGNVMGSLQQISMGSPQQNAVSTPLKANINTILSQNGVNVLQPNIPLLSNSNILQHPHLKQQQEQQVLQTQQLKQQFQQRQMRQQLMTQHMPQQQQQLQLNQRPKQQLPAQMQIQQVPQLHQMSDPNQLKIRQSMGVKPGIFQQHLSSGQRTAYPYQRMKQGGPFPFSSPQMLPAASPQLSQHSSPQVDQQYLLPSLTKAGTHLQSTDSPFIVSSASTPLAPSHALGDYEKPMYGISSLSNSRSYGDQQTISGQTTAPSLAIGTPGRSASPLPVEFTDPGGAHGTALTTVSSKPNVTVQPIERLIKAVKSMSPQALGASINDIGSVVCMMDRIAGEVPGNGPRAAVGEDLAAMTKCFLQEEADTRKMQRHVSAVPLNVLFSAGSTSGSYEQLTWPEANDLESTAISSIKRPRIEANYTLLEEIREINQRLVDTVVHVSDEDVDHNAALAAAPAEGGEGTIVKCSFSAVALSPNLKLLYASAQMSPIQPLRLLVPTDYPNCSPILLDKLPIEVSKNCKDLSEKAKSRLSAYLQRLSQPMSVSEIARSWDVCTRAVICQHAQQYGGGSFSSRYGTWDCLGGA